MSLTGPCKANSETGCSETPIITSPVSLCEEHALQVSLAVVPGLLSCRLAETRSRNEDGTRPLSPKQSHVVSSAVSVPMPETESHSSVVYFLANGGRVKIGQTRGLYNRIRSLSLRTGAVLLLLEGGTSLERALHVKFAEHRIGDGEWFDLTPEIVRFIGVKAHQGPLRRPAALNSRGQGRPVNQQVKGRKARIEAEVDALVALMKTEGYDAVDLKRAISELELKQTTAYDRLLKAQTKWAENAA